LFYFQLLFQVKVAKIGKWGGVGGRYNDIEIAPQRLESLTIQSGEVIYSLEFSYSDHSGQQHTGGPWGGYGPNKGTRYNHTVSLNAKHSQSEHIHLASNFCFCFFC